LHRKLKISEAVDIRIENTMAKRPKTKWQTTIYKTLHRKLVFCVMFYRSLFVILSFCLFVIVFSVLIFTASETFSILWNVS
jgi:hypothetical protein